MKGFISVILFVLFLSLLLVGFNKWWGFFELAPATPESARLNALNDVVPANFEHVRHVNPSGQAVIEALDKEQLFSKAKDGKQSEVFFDLSGGFCCSSKWKIYYYVQVSDTSWFTFEEKVKFTKAPTCMIRVWDVTLDKNGQVFMTVKRGTGEWYLWEYGFPIVISAIVSAIVCAIIVHGLSRTSQKPR